MKETSSGSRSFKTASEKAYKIISEKILNGELGPGCKLSRRKMAELTGVSVIPVIEALNRLEEDGLVESKPKWGSFVIIPTASKIRDMYYLREAIECQVVRILAERISTADEKLLRQMASDLDKLKYSLDTYKTITYLHYEFHSRMAECTGCSSIVSSLKRINLFWILCKGVSARRSRCQVAKDWHMRLIDAIVSKDPDKAENMMRIHIYDSLDLILEQMGEYENLAT